MAKLYDTVKDLLIKYPKLRDSDRLLIWNVWGLAGYIQNGVISREDFINAPHPESIRRCRQKIQETHPELQSSPNVQHEKELIEDQKGTHIYREKIGHSSNTIHFECMRDSKRCDVQDCLII
jgi:hypothetical protein